MSWYEYIFPVYYATGLVKVNSVFVKRGIKAEHRTAAGYWIHVALLSVVWIIPFSIGFFRGLAEVWRDRR